LLGAREFAARDGIESLEHVLPVGQALLLRCRVDLGQMIEDGFLRVLAVGQLLLAPLPLAAVNGLEARIRRGRFGGAGSRGSAGADQGGGNTSEFTHAEPRQEGMEDKRRGAPKRLRSNAAVGTRDVRSAMRSAITSPVIGAMVRPMCWWPTA